MIIFPFFREEDEMVGKEKKKKCNPWRFLFFQAALGCSWQLAF